MQTYFVGIIALEEEIIDSSKLVNCDGAYELKNHQRPFKCWKKTGHGDTDLSYALAQSCDVFFYRVAQLTGIDSLSKNLYKFGFGQKTYIDLYGEKTGLIPDRKWKSKVKQLPWYQGETLNVGIGQGYFLATPMQLTLATSVLATNGSTYTPHLLKRYQNNKTKEIFDYNPEENKFITPIDDKDDLDIVKRAMWRVVNEKNVGTAANLKKVTESLVGFCSLGFGLMTHLASVEDVTDQEYAYFQLRNFNEAIKVFKKAGFKNLLIHCASSAGSLLIKELHFDFSRVGISLYGFWPSALTRTSFFAKNDRLFDFRRVLAWKSKVSLVRRVCAGTFIGYGCTYRTERDMVIALVPVGYFEGYPRWCDKAYVL